MKLLKDYILEHGKVLNEHVLKVDSFLNHQLDPQLMKQLASEFKKRFNNQKITKILTIEASGIAVAILCGLEWDVPVVFAKKSKPSTITGEYYSSHVHSFTRNKKYDVIVSKQYLNENDHVLVIDDFLAGGHATGALADIIDQAKASLVGFGIVIEKVFQGGGNTLREKGLLVESLAMVESLKNNQIHFTAKKGDKNA
jgi:xanthine phosphoribosyltransferase